MNYLFLDEIAIPEKTIHVYNFFVSHGPLGPYSWIEPINTILHVICYVSLTELITIFILKKIFKKRIPQAVSIIFFIAFCFSFATIAIAWLF